MEARIRMFAAATVVAALAAGTLALAAVRAAEEGEEKAPGAAAPAVPAAELEALVRTLGDTDFAAREKAYARLKELGPAAREALGKGAASEDAQIRWASNRLLGLLEEPEEEGRGAGARLRFEEEEEEGRPDELGIPFPPGFAFGTGNLDLDRTMEEMRRRMAELEERFAGLRGRDPVLRPGIRPRGSMERHVVVERDGERTEVRIGSDGKVKVVLSKAGGGKDGRETFEAADAAALEKEHPEVWAKVKDLVGEGGTGWFRVGPLPEAPRPSAPLLPEDFLLRPSAPRTPGAAARGLLGVTVSDLPELLRSHLPVPAGEGLVVEEVLPGTPAERMGLRRFDLLLSVNGIPVSTAGEVRSAVGAVEEGGGLRLRLLREGREKVVEGNR